MVKNTQNPTNFWHFSPLPLHIAFSFSDSLLRKKRKMCKWGLKNKKCIKISKHINAVLNVLIHHQPIYVSSSVVLLLLSCFFMSAFVFFFSILIIVGSQNSIVGSSTSRSIHTSITWHLLTKVDGRRNRIIKEEKNRNQNRIKKKKE